MRERGGYVTYGYGRVLRVCGGLVACGVILAGAAGCSDAGGGDEGKRPADKASSSETPNASQPAPTSVPTKLGFTADPKRAPKTEADAKRLALEVVAGPESWGSDYVKRTPYLSGDDYWPVLDTGCTWEAGTRPRGVLHSVTAYSEVPAAEGKGLLRVSATVTVHRTESDADWEMAETLEEALRCPDQRLRDGERISGLLSLGSPFGVGGNFTAVDSLREAGTYLNDAVKGEQTYSWYQSRVGQVTVAAVVKGAPGHIAKDIDRAQVQALVAMVGRAEDRLEAQQ
ncbi:hypothetical protein Q5762_20205 [Streptomyces sp. P9(2023)]|uniref:hypothetical protein n=1 Tax=Streptomyces sp. P9(2023) TaxID=3064394 RepID=UPI0028F458D6|nr:hypothetical protein [Streptomyces sp. P9(2023)]MDT9690624.1 hypothetical protein [Streptomyces sp. P9(2023)]